MEAVMRLKQYFPHFAWLAFLILAFAAHWLAPNDPGRVAALFVNGVMINLVDPIVWAVAAAPALLIRRTALMVPALFLTSAAAVFVKGWLEVSTGSTWLSGSILGNLFGLVTVGFVINAISIFRRSRRQSVGA